MENSSKEKKFEILPHLADAKFRAYGNTLEEKFKNAALAMFSIITDTSKVKPIKEYKIEVEGIDLKNLLYNWLEELIFLIDAENFLLHDVKEIKIEGNKLKATVVGDDASGYETFEVLKAVTYNEMEITPNYVQVVVDI